MTDPNTPDREDSKQVTEQHHSIRGLCMGLLASQDLASALQGVAKLDALLERHFTLEEGQGGILDEILELSPNSQRDVERLKTGHLHIRTTLDQVRANAAEVDPAALTGDIQAHLLDQVRHVASMVLDHEEREEELFLDVLYRDLGAGG